MCLLKQIKKKLPIGIENFAKLQAEDFYYVSFPPRFIGRLLQRTKEKIRRNNNIIKPQVSPIIWDYIVKMRIII